MVFRGKYDPRLLLGLARIIQTNLANLSRACNGTDDLYFHNGRTLDPEREGLDPQLPLEVEGVILLKFKLCSVNSTASTCAP